MKLQMFCVFDKAVGAYLPPFYTRSKGEALRSFTEACNDAKHQFHNHASDYLLMYVGEWDDGNAVFSSIDPVRIVSAIECVLDDPFPDDKRSSEEVSAPKVKRLPM